MPKRIFLVHPTPLALPPVDEAFKTLWREAQIVNLLDESLYADVGANGELTPGLYARVANLFRHCEASGADGIVFSGSTFGPAVEEGRKGITVPVLRIEEGMMDEAVARGGSILVVSTQKRAMPVVRATLDASAKRAGKTPTIKDIWVEGARDALNAGDSDRHDRLIAEQAAAAGDFDTIVLSMISMAPARAKMPPALAKKTLTSGECAVTRLRKLLDA
ncbi:MAG: aspartate/glutamate racemase family protein [Xanthobacteraceae bacterium]|nr:aspartate/glutamate racemase family protein [Xanthobacteraceae bacterium]